MATPDTKKTTDGDHKPYVIQRGLDAEDPPNEMPYDLDIPTPTREEDDA